MGPEIQFIRKSLKNNYKDNNFERSKRKQGVAWRRTKVQLMTDFISENNIRYWNNIFKVVSGKILSTKNSISSETILQNWRKDKNFQISKNWEIHQEQYKITITTKILSSSGWRNMIPVSNLDRQERMKTQAVVNLWVNIIDMYICIFISSLPFLRRYMTV